MARLFVLDGSGILYRAHFAFLRNPLITSAGEHTSAVFGFLNTFLSLQRQENPDEVVVAFDRKGKTFRHELYSDYKATRPPQPIELREQFPRTKEMLDAMGIQHFEMEGMEADDLIGTLVEQAAKRGDETVIVSADKDFMQLIRPGVRQWIPPKGNDPAQWIDAAEVEEKFGVRPDQMIDMLALMGDSSDNVPGVAGVGPKTAAKLLQQFDSLDGIYQDLTLVHPKGVRGKLEKDREAALLSRELVTIRTDLKIEERPRPWSIPDLAARPAFVELLGVLEFRRILEGLGMEKKVTGWEANYQSLSSASDLERTLLQWQSSGEPLSIYFEPNGEDVRTADPVGFAFSWVPGEAYYVSLRVAEAANLDPCEVSQVLSKYLDAQSILVGHDMKTVLHQLARLGLPIRPTVRDSLLASYVLDPESPHALSALSMGLFQHKVHPKSDLVGRGKKQIPIAEADADQLRERVLEHADLPLRIREKLEPELESHELAELWRTLECPLIPVLCRMEQAGIGLDTDFLGKLSVETGESLERITAEIYEEAGCEFNIASPSQLGKVLFETLGLPKKKKTKTGFSTDHDVLEALSELHPVPRLVVEHRQLAKLKGTYLDTLPELVDPEDGRIHASYHQAVAATGRLSSSDPNIQNIPIRSEEGRKIRQAFIAPPGSSLISADYSQVELRVLAHLSNDPGLGEAFMNGHDVHAATAARLFGVDPKEVGTELRSRAKAINFGVIYGMGPQRISRELGIPLDEAKSFVADYFAKMPGVRGYLEKNLETALEKGYVTTILGRRRYLPGLNSSDPRSRAQAERICSNTPIQGSAADLIKRAMIDVDREFAERDFGARLLLQVHDELVVECPTERVDEVSTVLSECMERAVQLSVPLQVDLGVGANWGEAHS